MDISTLEGTRSIDIMDKGGRAIRLYDDGYRIYGMWTGHYPLNGPKEPILIMEYKHCDFPELAGAAIDLLMQATKT